jgi:glycosyltransferase domain-containing protein
MKIQIIIPTYNRHRYLERIHSYYKKKSYDQHLIIVDGSDVKWAGSVNFEGKYLYLPDLSFRERLIEGLEQSECEFAVLCADDDFAVPSGLEASAEFLRNNPDYACAQGQYGRFVINDGVISYSQKHAGIKSIVDKDPIQRVIKGFSPKFVNVVYAVHRKNNLEGVLNIQGMNEFHYNYFNFELLLTYISLLNGKVKRLPIIFYFREMENAKVLVKDRFYEEKIKGAIASFSIYSKALVETYDNKDSFIDLIDAICYNLKIYHFSHIKNINSKKSINKSNNITMNLSRLNQPALWTIFFNPNTLINVYSKLFSPNKINHKNSFPLKDADSLKEFEIIDNTLKNWIENTNTNIPES